MFKKLFILFLASGLMISAQAQEIWDLEKCIRYALDNNIAVKQADIGIENAKLTQQGNQLSQLPTLNGSSSFSFLFGRSIDPTSNQFKSQNIQSNNFGLSSGALLYGGLQIRNSIKQGKIDINAAEADKQASENDLALLVAGNYLNILQAEDQISIAANRLKQTEDLLARTEKLIQAGTLPGSNRLDIEAQKASDEQGLIAAENSLTLAYLALKQSLHLDPAFDMEISRPAVLLPVEGNPDEYSVESLYVQAVNTQPQIRASQLNVESAETGVKIAKGALHPQLSAFGGINTNYSSAAPDLENPIITNERIETNVAPVLIDGSPASVTFFTPASDISYPTRKYTQQLSDNVSENIGLSLQVPIFNGNRNRITVERAKLAVKSAEYNEDLEKVQLKADIQRALTDVRSARQQLEASEKTVLARGKAFENAEKKYNLGSINTYEYNQAKDNLDLSKSNQVFSTYDYVFKMKVLDYYLGKPITLE